MRFSRFLKTAILFLLCLSLYGCQGQQGLLWPAKPSPTPIGTVLPPPIPVNFETLNADPLVFRNKMIRVEGIFRFADLISCQPFKGPRIDFHMIADGFEMNISGFRNVIELAPELSPITVEGVWRLYQGPVGCGKEPESDFVWYLESVRIVEPNPFLFNAAGEAVVNNDVSRAEIPTNTPGITPTFDEAQGELFETPDLTQPTDTATPRPSATNTATRPATGATNTPVSTTAGGQTTGTPVRVTATPDGTETTAERTPSAQGTERATATTTRTGSGTPEPSPTSGIDDSGSGTREPATPEPGGPYPSPYPDP